MLTPFMFRKQTHVNESSKTRTHTREDGGDHSCKTNLVTTNRPPLDNC